MIRRALRWIFGIDAFERMEAELHQMEVHRKAYRDNARSLSEENSRLRKTIAEQRSLLVMLRDVNREMDERIGKLEGVA
jgi:hypothetical protein